jgi:hypothetical protein
MGELARVMFEPFTKLKRFLPIEVHHNYYSYGWWIGDKFIFFEKHWIPFIIVPMVSEHHSTVFAKNGKEIKDGYVHSWNRYYEQFDKDDKGMISSR